MELKIATLTLRRWEFIGALLLTLLALYFHFILLQSAGGLWRDEANTMQTAALPTLEALWSRLKFDSFPIAPALLWRLWASGTWGANDYGLRLLGFLIGLSIVAALWFNARAFGYSCPLLSLTLFALNPTVVRWGDAVRHYGLGTLTILLTLGLLWKVTVSPSPRRVFAALLMALLSVQCLYTNIFLLAALCLAAIVTALAARNLRAVRGIVVIGVLPLLSLLHYLAIFHSGGAINAAVRGQYTLAKGWRALALAAVSPFGWASGRGSRPVSWR